MGDRRNGKGIGDRIGGRVVGIAAALLLGGGLLAVSSVETAVSSDRSGSDVAVEPTVLAAVETTPADPTTSIGEAVTIPRNTVLAPAGSSLAPAGSLPAAAVAEPVRVEPPNTTVAVVPTSVAIAPVVTTAPAPPATPTAGPTPDQLLAQAIGALNYDVAATFPRWQLTVGPPRDGLRALTFPSRKLIEMYIRPSDTAASVARVLAHEIGHVVDIELNDGADRQAWRAARGIDASVPWWPKEGTFDFDTGAGDFAESFAVWLVGADSKTRVAAPGLTEAQRSVMAQLVAG
ncbi:MAG: hypothetical protein HKN26_11905 [Acidimicrobiales bacterium]|nr:hypothetical protein [Acidimicrobiales bacterium]